jgi:hypothetical protein
MTPFEQRLAATPRNELPPALRARVLAAARPRVFRMPAIFAWPHPLAWGAVAAAWIAIVALNVSGPRGPELYAVTPKNYRGPAFTAEDYVVHLRLRDAVLASLDADSADAPFFTPIRSEP